ncbi:DUF4864 domain-containing protein [Chthonobacter rhizosphaerae]|uniref:DUF4864 domain-containing protein n=1 Tax=Chthonobacter rhizosphaerae TaxID=2735553 RepID=UPI0015EFADE1|nr:DUF4864 domain-containing protein [Chthonobacter rhizosphaerae]
MRVASWCLGFLLLTSPALAEDPASSIKSLIDRQIQAFQADDASTAYSFASPRLQEIFPNPDVFMSMVRSAYRPVYRPKSVAFGQLRDRNGAFIQEVFLVDPDGVEWTALYALQQQADGTWRIAGCQLTKEPRVSA